MERINAAKPSPALVVAVLALVAALAGSAVAEVAGTARLDKKSKKQVRKIANKQVQKRFPVDETGIADGAVTRSKLADGVVDSAKIEDGSLGTRDLSRSIPAVRVTHSVGQAIPSGPHATLRFDSERYDTAGMHSNTINNSRLTIPLTGIYELTADVEWSSADSDGRRLLAVLRNGTTFIAFEQGDAVSLETTGQELTTQARLRAGDFVQAQVLQNSGSGLNVLKQNEYTPEFAMTWLAPGP